MGLLDGLKAVLGIRAESDASRDADPDDLFGMSTAYITMEADLGYDSLDVGALCFSGVESARFEDAVEDVIAILTAGREETGTEFSVREDDHGYQWVVLEESDPEDLITSMHFVADTFIERGFGSRLLAAVFAYEGDTGPVYWIYSFRRGGFYPFAPRTGAQPQRRSTRGSGGSSIGSRDEGRDRDSSVEFTLEATLDGELDIEREKEYWYPLWPSERGTHPWE